MKESTTSQRVVNEGGKPCEIIAFHSLKGGTGKSLAAVNLSVCLSRSNINCVLLEMDMDAPSLRSKIFHSDDVTRLEPVFGQVTSIGFLRFLFKVIDADPWCKGGNGEGKQTYQTRFSEIKFVSDDEIRDAYGHLNNSELKSITQASENIVKFHQKQVEQEWSFETREGVIVGRIIRPLSSVGVYAPGGKAAYPSSVLMCALPAKVAGVERCIICSPPQKNKKIAPAILVAADIAGVTDWRDGYDSDLREKSAAESRYPFSPTRRCLGL